MLGFFAYKIHEYPLAGTAEYDAAGARARARGRGAPAAAPHRGVPRVTVTDRRSQAQRLTRETPRPPRPSSRSEVRSSSARSAPRRSSGSLTPEHTGAHTCHLQPSTARAVLPIHLTSRALAVLPRHHLALSITQHLRMGLRKLSSFTPSACPPSVPAASPSQARRSREPK